MSETHGSYGTVEELLAVALKPSLFDGEETLSPPLVARTPDRACQIRLAAAKAQLRQARHAYGFAGQAWQQLVHNEEAGEELEALCAETVSHPSAGPSIAVFISSHHTDGAGAQVFACLLHAAGDSEGARFWWQYAAGLGVDKAAYCLVLDHSRRGEYEDAQLWADVLAHSDFTPDPRWHHRPLSPGVRDVLAGLLACIRQESHEDLGLIPLPATKFAKAVFALAHHPQHRQPGYWMIRPTSAPSPTSPGAEAPKRLAYEEDRAFSPSPEANVRPAQIAAVAPSEPEVPGWAMGAPRLLLRSRRQASADDSAAMRQARHAHNVVGVLQKHPLGISARQIAMKTGLDDAALAPLLEMLCEEDFAESVHDAVGVYAPGLALDRLALPGGSGIGAQLQRTLAIARDHIGAAIYLSRYSDGDVLVTQASTSTNAPPVEEHTPFHQAPHASALGKCLIGQLRHDQQAEHITRYTMESFTARTCKDPRTFLERLSRTRPGNPAYDIREYDQLVVCSAVPASLSSQIGGLALSLPSHHAHRLPEATKALQRKAVPILLVLLLTGAIPTGTSAKDLHTADLLSTTSDVPLNERGVNHLRRMFATPLNSPAAIRNAADITAPHLVSDTTSNTLYLFDAASPESVTALALPRLIAAPLPSAPLLDTATTLPSPPGDLLVYGT
ncbi:IclR family transcriptional regulator domain-containing protein [Streptomyces sp. NBC_01296]|uniref:IclR family transcriptional regulator domain-containing protein n=1 Tax=Streptomyces sp. NBC_01296 TaxID=2903816 RepID=UPI002E15DD05|nr:IclR family transcriptional regulator C-terminal domain-containing protein [Streptomyces sp. NBC_01296]